jgi:hypothetical protein
MNRRLANKIKKKLRDPIWQSIGVFLGFITFFSPLIIAYLVSSPTPKILNRIMITSKTSKALTDFSEPISRRLRILIDNKEERDLRLFIFLIEYKGNQPVRSADFETPLRGRIPNNRKLVTVQKSSNLEGPLRFDRERWQFVSETQPPISFEAEVLDEQTFQIKPVLMNPGEWLGIEVYTAAANKASPTTSTDSLEKYKVLSSEVTWSCHVAGVQCPGTVDWDLDFEYLKLDAPGFLQVIIHHEGWAIYFILLVSIVSLLLLVLLARSSGLHKAMPIIQIALFSVGTALSIASAEVAADWLFQDSMFDPDQEQPIYAYIIFWLNILALIALAALSIWRRQNKKRVRRQQDQPAEES